VTRFAPHKDLKLIAWGKLTFDEKLVLHRVDASNHQDLASVCMKLFELPGRFDAHLSWGEERHMRCVPSSHRRLGVTVQLNDSGEHLLHCYGFQPESRAELRVKKYEWVLSGYPAAQRACLLMGGPIAR
jgi:hypothetical protein